MKKTYINPEMEIVELKTNHMLMAGSAQMPIDGTTDTVDSNDFELEEEVFF